jgi:O-antigen ligase
MSPSLAALVFAIGIIGLFYLDRDGDSRPSPAVWLPIAWFFIAASRMVSQWLSLSGGIQLDSPDDYLDGSPADRLVFIVMWVGAMSVLWRRSKRSATLLAVNWPLVLFFTYCLVSVLWSDYSFVAFKRWVKAIGNVAMVMVILTDPNPRLAFRKFLSSSAFLLIPLSVLLIKYYPEFGRTYLFWVWTPVYTGVTQSKNGLGYNCLIFGLSTLWLVLETFRRKDNPYRHRQLLAHGVVLLMVLWLFRLANSATSMACFVLGAAIILVLSTNRRPAVVHCLVVGALSAALLGYLVFDAHTYVLQAFGRDETLTGRTEIWSEVLQLQDAPFLGVGFESFWLGSRAEHMWKLYWWKPNQAHNGYLETYLSLGWVGLLLFTTLLVTGYVRGVRTIRTDPAMGTFKVAMVAAALFYNLTEAAVIAVHPMWIMLLLVTTALPERQAQEEPQEAITPRAVPTSPIHAVRPALTPLRVRPQSGVTATIKSRYGA